LPQDLQVTQCNVRLLQGIPISTQRLWRQTYLYSSSVETCSSESSRPSSPTSLVPHCGTGRRRRRAWIGAELNVSLTSQALSPSPRRAVLCRRTLVEDQTSSGTFQQHPTQNN
jgi:hypothetical protein